MCSSVIVGYNVYPGFQGVVLLQRLRLVFIEIKSTIGSFIFLRIWISKGVQGIRDLIVFIVISTD